MSGTTDPITSFIDRLRTSPVFGSIGEEGLAYLGGQAKRTTFDAGAFVFLEGDPSQGLYWLEAGMLKSVKYSTRGREQVLHLVRPGQTFNEVGALTTMPNPASVVALIPSAVWNIPGQAIRRWIQQDPAFAQLLIDVLSSRLRRSVDLIEDLSLRTVVSRLARLILDEAEKDAFLRPGWNTQDELAARLGTVADVLQRALRRLESEDIIRVERGRIVVLDRVGLEKLAA